jgi:hypothetical protein
MNPPTINRMKRVFQTVVFLTLWVGLGVPALWAQADEVKDQICGKWKVVWFSDDGKQVDMEARNQILILRRDGTGTMSMANEKVGDAQWTVLKKNKITFSDDPSVPAYEVKFKVSNEGKNMLFASKMPNGITRKVFFRALSGGD